MSDQLRDRLHGEMAGLDRPALGGLVEGAVTRGSRMRGRRRLVSGAGTTAVVAAVAAVVALSGQAVPGHSASVSGAAGSAPTAAKPAAKVPVAPRAVKPEVVAPRAVKPEVVAPWTTTPVAAPATPDLQSQITSLMGTLKDEKLAGKGASADLARLAQLDKKLVGPVTPAIALPTGVPATARGMLQLLTTLLPGAGHPGIADDGSLGVESYVSTPTGPAMVRVFLSHTTDVPVGCGEQDGCTVAPNGDIVEVGGLADNCIQTTFVTVIRPDGSTIMVNLSTCLEWDGATNAASPLAMTVEQATALAEDPRWDASMDPGLVSAGAAAFPTVHQFG
ncbi:hypothetical protein acdb102_44580 [Acidothermaceae bacterium B102]|nr:hypothetical protein acdb102_44580 [Acidothermaceae bacterium B102]